MFEDMGVEDKHDEGSWEKARERKGDETVGVRGGWRVGSHGDMEKDTGEDRCGEDERRGCSEGEEGGEYYRYR